MIKSNQYLLIYFTIDHQESIISNTIQLLESIALLI